MLKNAVEELEKLKEAGEKNLKLNIKFAKGNDFLQIKIENTIEKNHLFKGINTPTTKKDKSKMHPRDISSHINASFSSDIFLPAIILPVMFSIILSIAVMLKNKIIHFQILSLPLSLIEINSVTIAINKYSMYTF